MLYYLLFEMLYSRLLNLDALFLNNVLKNTIGCCSIMDTAGLRVPLSNFEIIPPLTLVMSQDLALQQGASRLQTSAHLWTFSVTTKSLLRILLSFV
jgi:hypothetical protein